MGLVAAAGVHQQPPLHRPTRQVEEPHARLIPYRIGHLGGLPRDQSGANVPVTISPAGS